MKRIWSTNRLNQIQIMLDYCHQIIKKLFWEMKKLQLLLCRTITSILLLVMSKEIFLFWKLKHYFLRETRSIFPNLSKLHKEIRLRKNWELNKPLMTFFLKACKKLSKKMNSKNNFNLMLLNLNNSKKMKPLNLKDNSDKEWNKLIKIIKKLLSLIKKWKKLLSPSQMMNTINCLNNFRKKKIDSRLSFSNLEKRTEKKFVILLK